MAGIAIALTYCQIYMLKTFCLGNTASHSRPAWKEQLRLPLVWVPCAFFGAMFMVVPALSDISNVIIPLQGCLLAFRPSLACTMVLVNATCAIV